jgi:glycosyltransferase involved in cell wall biosynthesis
VTSEKAEPPSNTGDAGARPRTLYLTFDGLLEPLGRSQILRYLFALSRRGLDFTVVSLERESDLADADAVRELEAELREHGIGWHRFPFRSGGARAVGENCRAVFRAAREVVRRDRVKLVHARSHVPASIAWALGRLHGLPYVFDMRGYWVDERADEGRWFVNPLAYRAGKAVEKRLVKDSAAVVTLTQLQADDLRAGVLKGAPAKPVEVITTCADYDEFDPARAPNGAVPAEAAARLRGRLTVGLVGSINASYRLRESLQLFKYLLEERPDAHLICLTRQLSEMKDLLAEHGIGEGAYTLATARHQEMAGWMRHMRWALLVLNTRYSKRGSMPTKLAEFFAAGVRPIQYGCNEEVSRKVAEAGSGVVLRGVAPEDLRAAARAVAASDARPETIMKARESTRAHFSLRSGAEKYEALLKGLLRGAGR